jgi:hypothetical protein
VAKVKLGDDGKDSLTFRGGFATNGTTPVTLGTVRFSIGSLSLSIPGDSFTQKGDVFRSVSKDGARKVTVTLDFLRETVSVSAKGVELGALTGETADFTFDAGTGDGAIRNTVRLGTKGAKRLY